MTTDTPREELTVDKLHRALAARTGGHLNKATGDQLADSLEEAGLGDAPTEVMQEALEFVVRRWKAACERETLIGLMFWEPSDDERNRPH